jgi:hypothetical protein
MFYVLRVNVYRHRVPTQLQLINISISIPRIIFSDFGGELAQMIVFCFITECWIMTDTSRQIVIPYGLINEKMSFRYLVSF